MKMHPDPLPIGAQAPSFELPATNGVTYTLGDFDGHPLFVYVQGSNRCPYVLAYIERIKSFAATYGDQGVQMVMVNSNDADESQQDVYAAMKSFDDTYELNLPYLRDALDALLAGEPVPEAETYPVGCTVKWKSGNEPRGRDRMTPVLTGAQEPSS